ncbi:MAG: (2Fe-2S) ferredoxin domain-containing protein [Pseudoflavonifractor sp.]
MMTLSVCIGSSCHLKGSYNVIQAFQQMIEEYEISPERLEFKAAFCMKQCENPGVGVCFNGKTYNVLPEAARMFFRNTVMPAIE